MNDKSGTVKAVLLALGIAVALSPLPATAKGGARATFEEVDANADGKITAEEMTAHRAARFAAADANGDGLLDTDELAARADEARAKRIERMVERFDANNDGKLSAEELAPPADRMAKRFERLDADADGSISKAEFDEAREGRHGRHHKHRGQN